jgi:hypothetical protein
MFQALIAILSAIIWLLVETHGLTIQLPFGKAIEHFLTERPYALDEDGGLPAPVFSNPCANLT